MDQVVKKVIEMNQENATTKPEIEKPENKPPTSSISRRDSIRAFFSKGKLGTSSPARTPDKKVVVKKSAKIEEKFNVETASSNTNWDEESMSTVGNDMDEKVTASADCVAVDVADGKSTKTPFVAKKTAAQGLMDIALLTANANQLRYLIEYSSLTTTYYINIFLISLSLILQLVVGISLIFKGRYYYRGQSKRKRSKRLNNFVLVGIFLITIINVFVASFTTITPVNQLNGQSVNKV